MKLFDYLFLRVYKFYDKKRNELPVLRGCIIVSLLLFFTLLSIFVLFSIVLKYNISNSIKPLALILMIILFVPLWRRYNKGDFIKELLSRYKDEEIGIKRLRGWLFILYLILVMLIPISIGYMRHNLGMNI